MEAEPEGNSYTEAEEAEEEGRQESWALGPGSAGNSHRRETVDWCLAEVSLGAERGSAGGAGGGHY